MERVSPCSAALGRASGTTGTGEACCHAMPCQALPYSFLHFALPFCRLPIILLGFSFEQRARPASVDEVRGTARWVGQAGEGVFALAGHRGGGR